MLVSLRKVITVTLEANLVSYNLHHKLALSQQKPI